MIRFEDILLEKERDLTPLLLRTTNVKAFVNAVTNRNPISFDYYGPRKGRDSVKSGKRKKVEGVTFGVNKKGKMVLRAYVNPPSVSKLIAIARSSSNSFNFSKQSPNSNFITYPMFSTYFL